jgi:uncharacterized surface protein with fasciclin (FAS1) repeats
MKRTILRQTGAAAAALALSVSLAACGSDDEGSDSAGEDTSSETTEETSEEPMEEEASGPFGPACSQVPTEGEGSVEGMADDPVATAASNNPLLETLVAAVGEAGLADTLNSAEGLTVFAPANDAFGAFSEEELNGLLADKETLTQVLTHHVLEGQIGPDELEGEQTTLNGDTLMIEGSGESLSIGDEGASVLCGNVQTANATVYVIDTVLMP